MTSLTMMEIEGLGSGSEGEVGAH